MDCFCERQHVAEIGLCLHPCKRDWSKRLHVTLCLTNDEQERQHCRLVASSLGSPQRMQSMRRSRCALHRIVDVEASNVVYAFEGNAQDVHLISPTDDCIQHSHGKKQSGKPQDTFQEDCMSA